eukprot:TCONS_00056244-protein
MMMFSFYNRLRSVRFNAVKNPILIYEFIFRPAMLTYGVWEQVRMDHGQEFCLVSFAQTIMSHHRLVGTSEPFRMTTSTKNNVIERFWPEMNTRVNYHLKRALNTIIANDITDILMKVIPYSSFVYPGLRCILQKTQWNICSIHGTIIEYQVLMVAYPQRTCSNLCTWHKL